MCTKKGAFVVSLASYSGVGILLFPLCVVDFSAQVGARLGIYSRAHHFSEYFLDRCLGVVFCYMILCIMI